MRQRKAAAVSTPSGAPPVPMTHVHAGADDRGRNAGGKVAIADEPNSSADGANFTNELFVPRAVKNHHYQVFDVALQTLGDGFQIVSNGGVEFNSAFAGRADDDFFHVQIGSMKQAAALTGSKNGDGIGSAGGAEIGAFKGVNGDIDLGKEGFRRMSGKSDLFADVQHGGFIAFAFSDDDGAVHFHLVHGFTHGLDGDFVGFFAIAKPHGARGGNRSIFDHAQEFQTETLFHRTPLCFCL